jgi:RNA polymerase sigma-70 factor (ECF subfamily)
VVSLAGKAGGDRLGAHPVKRSPGSTKPATAPENLTDEWLMGSYCQGNHAALSVLIHRYERELFSYLRRMTGDAALAEDVFQNTFLQVHQKKHMYGQGRTFRPWLYTIATNQAIDALRRNQRHRILSLNAELPAEGNREAGSFLDQLEGNFDDPLTGCARSERRELVRTAVDQLSEHLRVVVVLAYYQGMKYKEIAEVLDIPVGTVKSRLHAAVQRLGEAWNELGLTEEKLR